MPNGRLEGRLEGVFICTVVQFGLFSVCIRVYDKYTLAKGLVRIRKRGSWQEVLPEGRLKGRV